MSNLSLAILLAVISLAGTVFTGIRSWLRDRQKRRAQQARLGQVKGTNADELWDIAEGMREELAAALAACRKETEELRQRVSHLEDDRITDHRTIGELQRELATHRDV
jgi:hypothetical protein